MVQFFLSQEVTGKDKALEQLNAKIAQLNDLLSLEKLAKITLDDQVGQLRAGLAAAEGERDRIKGLRWAGRRRRRRPGPRQRGSTRRSNPKRRCHRARSPRSRC